MVESQVNLAVDAPVGRVARVLLVVQAVLGLAGTVGMGLWVVFEEPWSPEDPVGRDLTAEEVGATAGFVLFVLLTVWAWRRLRKGRPGLALILGSALLLLTLPSLLSGFELAWLAAMQVAIVVSAWRARGQQGET
jgi:hypothetical protein